MKLLREVTWFETLAWAAAAAISIGVWITAWQMLLSAVRSLF